MNLHPDTEWILEAITRELIAAAPFSELFQPDLFRRLGGRLHKGGICKGRQEVAVRHYVIGRLRAIRIGGHPLSTTRIGDLLDVHHSTVVKALQKRKKSGT